MRDLTNDELWVNTKNLFSRERETTLEILHHMIEIERRRLYAQKEFSSLWDMVTRGFGLDGGAGQRRVDVMRLLRDHPQVEEPMRDGRLCFMNAAAAQRFFRAREMSRDEQQEFLKDIEGKSTREVERMIAKRAPKQLPHDKTKALGAEHTEITTVVDNETLAQIEELKNLLSHVKPNMTYGDLLKVLAKLGLEKYDKTREPKHKRLPALEAEGISAADEREVWRRAKSRCQWPGCVSRHLLETDHIIPRALGGSNQLENLRLLCRTHNLQAALEKLGDEAMAPYIGSSAPLTAALGHGQA